MAMADSSSITQSLQARRKAIAELQSQISGQPFDPMDHTPTAPKTYEALVAAMKANGQKVIVS